MKWETDKEFIVYKEEDEFDDDEYSEDEYKDDSGSDDYNDYEKEGIMVCYQEEGEMLEYVSWRTMQVEIEDKPKCISENKYEEESTKLEPTQIEERKIKDSQKKKEKQIK